MPVVTGLISSDVRMTGKNLAVVMRYARKSPVYRVRVDVSVNNPTQYAVTFYFDDQTHCLTIWNDWRVLLDWVLARRSWGVDRVYFAHPGLCTDWSWPAISTLRKRGTNVVESPAPQLA